jgi:plasmid stabilization system protein ParE
MKRYEVSFRPRAEADLFGLYDYIAEQAGIAVAAAYID